MSDASPAAPVPTVAATDMPGVPALAGSDTPTGHKKKAPGRSHADATDTTIEILRENLVDARRYCDVELNRHREECAKEKNELKRECEIERQQYEEANRRSADLGAENEGLRTENQALRRDQSRIKWIEIVATILMGVGGGAVSYTTDQNTKNLAMYAIIAGAALFFGNLLISLIVGNLPERQRRNNGQNGMR